MQLHDFCKECNKKSHGCRFILESPYFRTNEEEKKSLKTIKNVAKLVN